MTSRFPTGPTTLSALIGETISTELQRISRGDLDTEIKNSNEELLATTLAEKCRIPNPEIKIDEWKATVIDTSGGGEVKYFIPFEGPARVAHLLAPKYVTGGELVNYGNGWEFRVLRNDRSAEDIRNVAGQNIESLRESVAKGEQSIAEFNAGIEGRLKQAIIDRKQEIESRDSFLDELNRRD